MADIRINALATTATSSASDDYIAIDGSANGTRKLSVYSPTFGGNLTVSGTGAISGGLKVGGAGTFTTNGIEAQYISSIGYLNTYNRSSLAYEQFNINGLPLKLNPSSAGNIHACENGGNLLLGTPIDSGNGKLQLATHTTSAGGIGFGTDTSLYRKDGNSLVFQPAGTYKNLFLYGDANVSGIINAYANFEGVTLNPSTHAVAVTTNGATALTLASDQTATFSALVRHSGSGGGIVNITSSSTTGLITSTGGGGLVIRGSNNVRNDITIADATGNITFVGTISPQQAATASAPSYVKGAIYFDTTLNKLRVGGATGWETITSV